MKLKYIFTALVAALTLAVGCEEDIERHLDEVRVSSSYVAIPAAGGSQTITVDAKSDWSFGEIPSWLTVSPENGSAGETTVTFNADAATSTNEAMLYLTCDGKSQIINVLQMTEKVDLPITSCKEFNENGEDGKSYRVKGTVTKIVNTTYGNMYINDGTGEAYVYGTLDASGAEKNFLSLGIEAGDILTVEGPRKTYSGTVELVNVTVISIEKSLIKVDSVSVKEALPVEGGEFKAYLTCKGEGVSVVVPDDAKSWLSVTSIETSGTNATVTFNAAGNTGGDRSTTLVFNTTSNGKAYSAQTSLEQKGAIIDATVAEFLAAAEDGTQYRVTGVITNISASQQYHNANITISSGDFSSSVLLYRVVTSKGNIEDLGLVEGDVITVVGKRSSYKGTPQMAEGGVYESHIHYNKATLAEFLAAPVSNDIYAVTGEITAVANLSAQYNNVNITIKDESNTLYLYRVTTFDKSGVATLNPEVGGTITVAGKRGEYNGSAQMAAGGVVLAYSAPTDGGDETPDADAPTYTLTVKGLPSAYPTEETVVTLSGLECYIYNVANFGSGIQMMKGGSYIANKSALKKITKIKVTVADGKTYYPDNVSLYVGTSAKPEGSAIKGTSDDVSTTFDLSDGDYTFFTIKNASTYAVYFSKIEITCEK